jgi:hypothetical protein
MATNNNSLRALQFRDDLWTGMPLEDALQKNGLSLLAAFNILQYKQPYGTSPGASPKRQSKKKRRKRKHGQIKRSIHYIKCDEEFIMQRNNTFCVRKYIKGRTRMFGTYDSLEDAIRMREALKEDGWHQTHVDRIAKELGILRRTGHPNSSVRYR